MYKENVKITEDDILIHVDLGEFEDGEPHLEGLVDPEPRLLELDTDNIGAEDTEVHEVRFADEFEIFLLVIDQLDISPLLLIFARLPEHPVIHQFEELGLELVLGIHAERLILDNIFGHPSRLLETDGGVNFCQL